MPEVPQGLILDEESLRKAVDYFLTQPSFVFDVEGQGPYRDQPNIADISWISLATYGCCIVVPMAHERGEEIGTTKVPVEYASGKKLGQIYMKTVPVYSKAPKQIDRGTVFEILRPLFESTVIAKGGHDVLYDLVGVAKYLGFVPPPPYNCTKIGKWLLNENNRRNTWLKEAIQDTYDFTYDDENVGKCVESHPFSTVAFYSYCDSKFDWLLANPMLKQLEEQGLMPIYRIEMAVLNVMIGMRLAGVRIDVPRLKEIREELKISSVKAESAIYASAGKKFNVNSNKQKQELLFGSKSEGNQGLRPWKITDSGKKMKKAGGRLELKHYSVDDAVMESFPDNAVCCAIREYGDITKVLSTYVESWLGNGEDTPKIYDERIYAGFQQYGTVTGRFSCRAPNLQNLPRATSELGKMLRDVFIAEEGGKLIVADYSQIELVVLAHYIGEGKLFEGFQEGIDPHTMTAAMVLGKDPADVTKVERQDLGKTLGFAVVYGAGLGKVSSMAHITFDEAKRVLKQHEKMFPEIHQFKQDVIDLARSRNPCYITTLLGRKRRIPELRSRDDGVRMGAERQVFNSLIQGGAADLMKLSMIRLDSVLPNEAKLIMTVHDEVMVTAPDSMVDEVMQMVIDSMTGPNIQKLVRVPLKIEIHSAERWSEAK